jgi:hypothetical protein
MMTLNRLKMLTTLKQCGECTIQQLADSAGVTYQTAWRWIEQQIDLGNVEKVYPGENSHGGRDAARFACTGDAQEQAATLLDRARDLMLPLTDDSGAVRLVREIDTWMARNDLGPNVKSTANLQGFADGLLHNLGVTP